MGCPLEASLMEGNPVQHQADEEQPNLGSQSNFSVAPKRREQRFATDRFETRRRRQLADSATTLLSCCDVRVHCQSKIPRKTNGRFGRAVRCCENATSVCLTRRSRQNSEFATPARSQKCRFSGVFSANGLSLAYSYLCGSFGPKDACRANGSPFPLGSPLQQSGCDPRFVHLFLD